MSVQMAIAFLGAAALPAVPHDIHVDAPKATLTLRVAAEAAARARGLMFVTALEPRHGMIFVFERDEKVTFWMKNTLIPLDMIFIAADGTVRAVFVRVPATTAGTPQEKIPLRSAQAKYVIEIAAGEAVRDGIVPGTKLRFTLPR